MSQYGINVPAGIPVFKLDEVEPAAQKLKDAEGQVVLKSQILAGGRGLGTFTNGFQVRGGQGGARQGGPIPGGGGNIAA